MTTKPVQVDLWKLIAGLMGSGAFGGGVTMAAMQTTMAVAETRIERNAADIKELKVSLETQIDKMQSLVVMMAQTATKLESLTK